MSKFILVVLSSLLFGCASNDKAIFVTSTSLSILEGDSVPAGVSVGYKRVDGYIGPNNANGSAPPIISIMETDGEVFNPQIRQLYATGNAALVASGGDVDNVRVDKRQSDTMMFGTSTSIGFSFGTVDSAPSFSLGYKRKEMSIIPLVKVADEGDSNSDSDSDSAKVYPAVFASIDSTISSSKRAFEKKQMFASGKAAVKLAQDHSGAFINRVGDVVDNLQSKNIQDIAKCYPRVSLDMRPEVWKHANVLDLYFEDVDSKGNYLNILLDAYDKAVSNSTIINPNQLYRADASYVNFLSFPAFDKDMAANDEDKKRVERLIQHANFVCGLSKLNNA